MGLKKQFLKSRKACKVTFYLSAEAVKGANNVKILGDFNNWEKDKGVPMKIKDGVYWATVELDTGKDYQFRYLIDDVIWENDWAADKYVEGPFGEENSVVMTYTAEAKLQK